MTHTYGGTHKWTCHTQTHLFVYTPTDMHTHPHTRARAGAYGSLACIPQGEMPLSACIQLIPQSLSHERILRPPTPPHKHTLMHTRTRPIPSGLSTSKPIQKPRGQPVTQSQSELNRWTPIDNLLIHTHHLCYNASVTAVFLQVSH